MFSYTIVYLCTTAPWTTSQNKTLLQNDFHLFEESCVLVVYLFLVSSGLVVFYFFLSCSSANPLKAVEMLLTYSARRESALGGRR